MTTGTKYPNPFYAAAGAGDLALEKLRELPDRLTDVSARARAARGDVSGLRERATGELNQLGGRAMAELSSLSGRAAGARQAISEIDLKADLQKARVVAERNAKTLAGHAQKVYAELVARGFGVVSGATKAVTPKPVTAKKSPAKKSAPKKTAAAR